MRSPVRDPHISLEEIFRDGTRSSRQRLSAAFKRISSGLNRFRKECRPD
jgi:hypothetical protein